MLLLQLVKVTQHEGISAGFGSPGSAGLSRPAGGAGLWVGEAALGQRLGFPGCWFRAGE